MKKVRNSKIKTFAVSLAAMLVMFGIMPISALASSSGEPAAIEVVQVASTDASVEDSQFHEVSFIGSDGTVLFTKMVEQGARLARPEEVPAAPAGTRFSGWFEDGAASSFDFENSSIGGALKLYARFEAVEAPGADGEEPAGQPPPAGNSPSTYAAPPQGESGNSVTPREEAGPHTVTFMANGQVWHTASVLHETLVDLPTAPQADAPFVGWFLQNGAPFNGKQLITSNLTLAAKFGNEAVLVTYLDIDGSVLEVLEGSIGQAVPKNTKLPAVGMGKEFSHWALLGGGQEFTGPLTASVTLVPVVKNVSLAVFVTRGSEIDPQSGQDGFKASEPKNDPIRPGYTFTGWYQNEEGTEPFIFTTTPIHGTTFIYAGWESAQANYIVNIWVEKANLDNTPAMNAPGSFNLHYTMGKIGKTGDDVYITDEQARGIALGAPKDTQDLLTYSTYLGSENKKISANGDTIINVYFTRTVFTFTFDVTDAAGTIYAQGIAQGPTYTIQTKLEKDVSAIWPTEVALTNGAYFINWASYYGNNNASTNYSYLSVAFSNPRWGGENPVVKNLGSGGYYYTISEVKRTSITLLPTIGKSVYTEMRYYYTELSAEEAAQYDGSGTLNGKAVRLWNGTYYQFAQQQACPNNQVGDPSLSAPRSWPGRDIEGFETIMAAGKGSYTTTNYQEVTVDPNNNRHLDIYYYMPRKHNTLTLITGAGTLVDAKGIFTGGNGTYKTSVDYGSPVSELLPEVSLNKYLFEGWYTNAARTVKYTGGNMPSNNLTLYAKLTGTEVVVIYTDGEQIARRTYERGHMLTAHNLEGTAYEGYSAGDDVPGKGHFEGWYYKVGTNVKATVEFPLGLTLTHDVYLLTAKLDPGTFTVTFQNDFGSGYSYYAARTVKAGSLNTLARSGHNGFVPGIRQGHTFQGWSTTPNGAVDFNMATRIVKDITVYAIWAPVPVTLTFDGNGGTTAATSLQITLHYGQSVESAGETAPGSESVLREGYTFAGWYTQASGGIPYSFATVLKYDTTVYAQWSANTTPPATTTPTTTPETTPPPASTEAGPSTPSSESQSQYEATGGTPPQGGNPPVGPTGNPPEDIVPLGGISFNSGWSLLSLMMALTGLLVAVLQVILLVRSNKNRQDEKNENAGAVQNAQNSQKAEQETARQSPVRKLLALAAGLLTGILFLVFDNMSLPMVLINQWTLWVALPFIVLLLFLGAQLVKRRTSNKEKQENAARPAGA